MSSSEGSTFARVGGSIELGDIAGFSITLFAVEFFTGVSRVIETLFDSFVLAPAATVTRLLVRLVGVLFGVPTQQINLAADQTAAAVQTQPLIGFVIAVAIVLFVAWVAQKGVDLST